MTPTPSLPNASGSSTRVRLEGTLDMVQVSDSNFRLILADSRHPGKRSPS